MGGPNWAEVLTAVSTGVLTLAAVWALKQIRELRGARRGQIMADISRRWDSDELIDAKVRVATKKTPEGLRDAIAKTYTRSDARKAEAYRLFREANLFEDLALLQQAGVIELSTISQWIGDAVVERWEHWQPTVNYLRELGVDSGATYSNWERLAQDIKVYRAGGRPSVVIVPLLHFSVGRFSLSWGRRTT